jgi:DNA-binding MarR family transcriptional regulator
MPKNPRVTLDSDFKKRYPEASPLATEAAMNLVLSADLLVKQIGKLLKPLDLTPSSGLVLSILADAQDPLSPIQIAERLIISRAAMSSLVDSLEKNGFVKRTPHSQDKRKLVIQITKKGREAAETFRPLIHGNQKAWFSVLSKDQQLTLIETLHLLQNQLAN